MSAFSTSTDINSYFASIKNEPNALYAFFKKMPKGGELHYHLAGGAYPETMLAVAAAGSYCLDKTNFVMSKSAGKCQGVEASDLTQHPELYAQTIRAWSLKDFIPSQETRHDHFFASFAKFGNLVADNRPILLAEIMKRAAEQHELYLEIMILADNAQATSFAIRPTSETDFANQKQKLLANSAFQANIKHTRDTASKILKEARQHLGCGKPTQPEACKLTIKFQYYVLREQPLEKVFAQALNGFAAAAGSKDIVGINLVQAEDGIISLRDYHKQMQVFNFLHQAYPEVQISLHAGELAPSDVLPENLRFHIREAINLGQAQRIGHGVDIAFENDSEALLQEMVKKSILTEINLISNKEILNITGKQHPLNYYLAHGVPVALSTDDEGILGTDLTSQYVEAAFNHGLDYSTLKMINRNTLTYSFLKSKSLWADAAKAIPVAACKDLYSTSCQAFIKENDKARLQVELEKKLEAFEKSYSRN